MRDLVMIPALGCNGLLYEPQREALRKKLKLHTHVPSASTFDAMIADLLAFAPREFLAMGTSMGGRLALETTLAAPDRVKGLVIIGSGPGPVADQAAGLRRSARIRTGEFESVVSEMAAMISHLPGPNGPATRDAFTAMCHEVGADNMARQSDALAHRLDRWPRLIEITCPTLLIWGNHDQFSPVADGMRMNSEITGSRLAIIEDCGHFPTLECPTETSQNLNDWLRDFKFA